MASDDTVSGTLPQFSAAYMQQEPRDYWLDKAIKFREEWYESRGRCNESCDLSECEPQIERYVHTRLRLAGWDGSMLR